jgi:hypothetical protein
MVVVAARRVWALANRVVALRTAPGDPFVTPEALARPKFPPAVAGK